MLSKFTTDKGKEVNSEGRNFAEKKLFRIVKSKAAMQRCRKFRVLNDWVKIR